MVGSCLLLHLSFLLIAQKTYIACLPVWQPNSSQKTPGFPFHSCSRLITLRILFVPPDTVWGCEGVRAVLVSVTVCESFPYNVCRSGVEWLLHVVYWSNGPELSTCFFVATLSSFSLSLQGWTLDAFKQWGIFIRYALPGMFMLMLDFMCFEIGTFTAGLLSQEDLAAQAVILQLGTMAYQVMVKWFNL